MKSELSSSESASFECQPCGRYAVATAVLNEPLLRSPYLSAAARQGFEAGEQITIKASNAQELGELHRRTTVPARVDKALRYLASKGRPGTPIWINIDLDFPAVGAEDKDEFGGLTVDQIRTEVVLVFGTQKGAFLR